MPGLSAEDSSKGPLKFIYSMIIIKLQDLLWQILERKLNPQANYETSTMLCPVTKYPRPWNKWKK